MSTAADVYTRGVTIRVTFNPYNGTPSNERAYKASAVWGYRAGLEIRVDDVTGTGFGATAAEAIAAAVRELEERLGVAPASNDAASTRGFPVHIVRDVTIESGSFDSPTAQST